MQYLAYLLTRLRCFYQDFVFIKILFLLRSVFIKTYYLIINVVFFFRYFVVSIINFFDSYNRINIDIFAID